MNDQLYTAKDYLKKAAYAVEVDRPMDSAAAAYAQIAQAAAMIALVERLDAMTCQRPVALRIFDATPVMEI